MVNLPETQVLNLVMSGIPKHKKLLKAVIMLEGIDPLKGLLFFEN
jgi:hypothetical protein